MPNFDQILGNEAVKQHFITAVRHEKVSHAYLLEGEKGSGKKTMALSFAKLLQCENRQGDRPCGKCTSCIQIEHGDHPDVVMVTHEKPAVISVKEIREQVVNTVEVKPYKGPYKIYIVDEAEKMNAAAQNAVLKTIEEPPSYAIILLLSVSRGAFLQTILSRCVQISMKPVPDAAVRTFLKETYHISGEEAEFAASFAMGNVGKAVSCVLSEDFKEVRRLAVRVLARLPEMEVHEISAAVKELKGWKNDYEEFLDMMLMWFRDVLWLKSVKGEEGLIFKEEDGTLHRQCVILSYESLNRIMEEIGKARRRIKANVNFDTAMELLFMEIRGEMG